LTIPYRRHGHPLSVDELVEWAKVAKGEDVFNPLEALEHCPTTREGPKGRVAAERLAARTDVPSDGQPLTFEHRQAADASEPERSGVQKWITAPMSGT
jgi:hypothetical protein